MSTLSTLRLLPRMFVLVLNAQQLPLMWQMAVPLPLLHFNCHLIVMMTTSKMSGRGVTTVLPLVQGLDLIRMRRLWKGLQMGCNGRGSTIVRSPHLTPTCAHRPPQPNTVGGGGVKTQVEAPPR